MSSSEKRLGLECPVCGGSFTEDDLSFHVNLHFEDEGTKIKCEYPTCTENLNESQYEDHVLAHQMCYDNSTENEGNLNDSILARIIHEENETAGPSTPSIPPNESDEELARKLQSEDNERLETESFKELQETYGMDGKKGDGFAKQFEMSMAKKVGTQFSVGEYYEMKSNVYSSLISGYDSGKTRTTGITKHLMSSWKSDLCRNVYFSSETDHFSVDIGDRGWGCGYRNIQMLLSSLLSCEPYRENLALLNNKIPSVPNLQMLIEKAWENGYDTAGCQQLGGSLQGSKKWIGTTEVAALLSWLKISCKIIDFHKPTGHGGLHPELFNWIHNYFMTRNADENSFALPLYIQHQGHSRLCIGCEVSKNNSDSPIKILMFDPGIGKTKMDSLLKSKTLNNNQLNLIKKTIKQMKFNQFQLLYVDGLCTDVAEIEASKIIRSERIPP